MKMLAFQNFTAAVPRLYSEAISAAKKSGEDTVTIMPEIKGKVNGIAVSLPKSAAANAAKQGCAAYCRNR